MCKRSGKPQYSEAHVGRYSQHQNSLKYAKFNSAEEMTEGECRRRKMKSHFHFHNKYLAQSHSALPSRSLTLSLSEQAQFNKLKSGRSREEATRIAQTG